jgi:pimeloyl-ACP methyl ester carboxylesterase
VEDERLRVCLHRTVELESVRLQLRDWPGLDGPLVHVPDPVSTDERVFEALAESLAPKYRVLSLQPRGDHGYQVDAADLLGTLDQFGFADPVLVGERLGCVTALLVAAWHPGRVGRLVLVDSTCDPPETDGLVARALRDCPPDWPSLRKAVRCRVLTVGWDSDAVARIEHFLQS